MAINATTNLSLVTGDGITGNTSLTKAVPGLAFTGIMENYLTSQTIGVAAPAAPTCTPGTGGSMAAGNYLVTVTYVNAPQGESLASPESTSQTVAASGKLTVTSPAASAPATGYNVYITAAGGSSGTETKQNSTPIAIGTNYVQTAAVTAGAAMPGSNTTLNFTLTLPVSPVQVFYAKNISSGSQSVALTWTPQGGSSNKVCDLMPSSAIVLHESSAGSGIGGITAVSLAASAPGAQIETIFVG